MQSSHEHSYCSNQSASFLNYSEKPPGVRLGLVLDPDSEADTLQFVCDPYFDFNQYTLCEPFRAPAAPNISSEDV